MKRMNLGKTNLQVSAIGVGCMRIAQMETKEALSLITDALACGVNFFDHADIYGGGASEKVFGKACKEGGLKRADMIIQSKCGIRQGLFDFSKKHICASVDGILKRLDMDYLDVLLLHRPDTLMEPEEVGQAFDLLYKEGKVRHFGVSNQNGGQMALLQKYMNKPLVANQLQFSCTNTGMIDAGLNVNMKNCASVDHDNSVLEYCRLHEITIQTWSPLQYGFFEGTFIGNEKYEALNQVLNRIGEEQNVTSAAVAIAFILRHPANMQAIVGTTKGARLTQMAKAADVKLSREEWYEIYRAAGNVLP